MQGSGDVCLGGYSFRGDFPQPVRVVAGCAVLGAAHLVGGEACGSRGQLHLYARVARLDAVGGAVVEGDPVGEDLVGVQALDQESSLGNGREPSLPLISPTSVSSLPISE